MGLLVFGGMLIPGNIPNIIAAGKLGITSGEYAKLGVPFGIILGAFFFVLIYFMDSARDWDFKRCESIAFFLFLKSKSCLWFFVGYYLSLLVSHKFPFLS